MGKTKINKAFVGTQIDMAIKKIFKDLEGIRPGAIALDCGVSINRQEEIKLNMSKGKISLREFYLLSYCAKMNKKVKLNQFKYS